MQVARPVWFRGKEAIILLLSLWLALIPGAAAAEGSNPSAPAAERAQSDWAPQLILPESELQVAREDHSSDRFDGSSPEPSAAASSSGGEPAATPDGNSFAGTRSGSIAAPHPVDRYRARAPPLF